MAISESSSMGSIVPRAVVPAIPTIAIVLLLMAFLTSEIFTLYSWSTGIRIRRRPIRSAALSNDMCAVSGMITSGVTLLLLLLPMFLAILIATMLASVPPLTMYPQLSGLFKSLPSIFITSTSIS